MTAKHANRYGKQPDRSEKIGLFEQEEQSAKELRDTNYPDVSAFFPDQIEVDEVLAQFEINILLYIDFGIEFFQSVRNINISQQGPYDISEDGNDAVFCFHEFIQRFS